MACDVWTNIENAGMAKAIAAQMMPKNFSHLFASPFLGLCTRRPSCFPHKTADTNWRCALAGGQNTLKLGKDLRKDMWIAKRKFFHSAFGNHPISVQKKI
jgi:hypothetical protein